MRRNISVAEAVEAVRAAAPEPRPHEVTLHKAHGRVLAESVVAVRDQPPFDASAMDGYAVTRRHRGPLQIIGESVAGRGFGGALKAGEAVRIFTGAPVPLDARAVIIQEHVARDGDAVTVLPEGMKARKTFIRPAGGDFRAGDLLLKRGQRLDAWALTMAAAAGCGTVHVAKRPRVAVLANGDELVAAGESPRDDQVFESASFAVMALAKSWGAKALFAGHAADSEKAILKTLKGVKADLIVTIGGASVGDHDLVKPALDRLGLVTDFVSVNVRPGRPTWFGRLGDGTHVLGLPGNPASALVCAELFLRAFVAAALGHVTAGMVKAVLSADTPADGPREAYLRAALAIDDKGVLRVTPFREQDSSLIQVFAQSGALIRVPPGAERLKAGTAVEVIVLDRM